MNQTETGIKLGELEIIIAGKTGSGKSNLAAYLARQMKSDGFDVSFIDPDVHPLAQRTLGNPDAIESIKTKCKIRITNKQLSRTA